MPSTGHSVTHLPQPVQVSLLTWVMKLVLMGRSMPNRRAAVSASQQHPQQLQMKLTFRWLFSPNCTK